MMRAKAATATILLFLFSPVLAYAQGGSVIGSTYAIVRPSEYQMMVESFAGEGLQVQSSEYELGGSLVFQKHETEGMRLLEKAAAEGQPEAAYALGFATGQQGDLEASYQWFRNSADNGNTAAAVLAGRGQLYGLGTEQDFDAALTELQNAYEEGQTTAAAELAKAAVYGWADSSTLDSKQLWADAIKLDDPANLAEYVRYLDAGGVQATDQNIEQLTTIYAESQPLRNASTAWDIAKANGFQDASVFVDSLTLAHQSGDLDATARLGEALALYGNADQQSSGLQYLIQAAEGGKALAYTGLGTYYLQHPDEQSDRGEDFVVRTLQTGLSLGDPDAASVLSQFYLRKGQYDLAFDYALTNTASGTEIGRKLALESIDAICLSDDAECEEIVVAFATSRRVDRDGTGALSFTALPSQAFQPTFGFAKVMIPTAGSTISDQEFNLLSAAVTAIQNMFGMGNGDQSDKTELYFSTVDGWNDFKSGIVVGQDALADDQILLFVHGVSTSFEGAILAAAHLKARANLPGIPVIYSWPAGDAIRQSEGVPKSVGYLTDVNVASRNCIAFQKFLVDLTTAFQPENTTVIAHSHGSELVENGLSTCKGSMPEAARVPPTLRNVIYAAPDVDSEEFAVVAPQITGKAQRVTLYASNADMALYLSGEVLSGNPRAGMGGPRRTVVSGVDTVDLSNIASGSGSPDGHGYVFTSNAVLDDLNDLVRHNSAPEERCLNKKEHAQELYFWEFKEGCGLQ